MGKSWRSVSGSRVTTEANLVWRCRARLRVWLGRCEAQRIV